MSNVLERRWKLFVIHHSHTDIGYTERQEKIEQYHVDFIKQAIAIVKAARSGERKEWEGFRWTCETFWAVERFWEQADDALRKEFIEALKRGDIELSGTYLNMTELIDYETLRRNHGKAAQFAKAHGVALNSAMTADINGYSWGYAQSLADAGVENLLSCVHTHHGMYAVGRKQIPFYWETPKGDRLLVWNGEHYMLGNDLGLSPGAVLSYTIRDEYHTSALMENHWEMAENRIHRYLRQLEKENYPYDFALVNVMGLLRDNAAPNGAVMEFIRQWNERFGERIEIEMTTLSRFFDHVRAQNEPIPVYRGDWPDWWSDGFASTAMHTQIFRDAQRTLRLVRKLDPKHEVVKENDLEEAEYQLSMYAEHTWGYHSSVYEPWHPMVQALGVRKEAYAANGSRLACTALDRVLHEKGEALLAPGLPFIFKVINPYDHEVEDLAYVYLDNWEPPMFKDGFKIVASDSGETIPHQEGWVSRGYQVAFPVKLGANEERMFTLVPAVRGGGATTKSSRLKGNDGVYDMNDLLRLEAEETRPRQAAITENFVESPNVRIEWKAGDGIVSWIDKRSGRELLRSDRKHHAFTPVYEVTPAGDVDQMANVRRKMGRNRKGMNVQRHAGKLIGVKEITNGPLFAVVELLYETAGMSYYSLFLKVYNDQARVDVSVRMHKESVWDPENVYISLPFGLERHAEELWLEKAGALIRPGIDQLPGTCLDFYTVQEGLALTGGGIGLSIAVPDTPLIQLGPLEYGTRLVHGQQAPDSRPLMYAWVLTNYWETNFKATLGGYYEFRYIVRWGDRMVEPEKAIEQCRSANTGLVCFRTADK